MTFGCFDVLHKGHEHYFKEAKSYGDYLIVVVARDKNILMFKGRQPKHDENHRLRQVKKLDFVDEAVLGRENDTFKILEDYEPEVICLGYDQKAERLEEELKRRNLKAKIVRAKSFKPEIYKSSKLS